MDDAPRGCRAGSRVNHESGLSGTERFPRTQCVLEALMSLISRSDAEACLKKQFGEDVRVCLEPDDAMAAKTDAGKSAELWCWNPTTGHVGRGDGKFYEGRLVQHPGGWNAFALHEEPGIPKPEEGTRIVGHLVVTRNEAGLLKVRTVKGLNGEALEFQPSSVSKDEHEKITDTVIGTMEANCQRIEGVIAVYLRTEEFPVEQGMSPTEFKLKSKDGRSLSALGILEARGLI